MSILLYLEEEELSLVFKSLRRLRNYEMAEQVNSLLLRLSLLHGDLDLVEEESN
jgi:hypothetical protein